MKRYFKAFWLIQLVMLSMFMTVFTSCNDDDDVPDVDFYVGISGAKNIDNVIYLVRGDTLYVDSIKVVNREVGKEALISSATYYWDYMRLGTAVLPPYGFAIATTDKTPVGNHLLEIETPVAAVDKPLAVAILAYTVKVVADSTEIPGNPPTNTFKLDPTYK